MLGLLTNTKLHTFRNLIASCANTKCSSTIVDSSNTDFNSAWMGRGLRSVLDESTIQDVSTTKNTSNN